ncbi:MAG: NAD-dependent epimerase/dehydratase family protein [Candidatus Sericytochromatia bacterium]
MKILVTGATGFLGKRIVQKLIENKNYEVLATGRNEKAIKELNMLNIKTFQGSLEDENFVNKIGEGLDLIVHSAALSSPWGKYEEFYNANVLSTKNIIYSAKKNNIKRIVNISTPSIYFDYTDRFDIKENFLPNKFVNFYAQTKYEAEKIMSQANNNNLETISLRPRAIIGAGDTTIMPRLLKAQQEGKLKIIGSGENIVDVSSAANVVEAVELSIKASKDAMGESYNITNGTPVKLWWLIEEVLSKLGYKLNKNKIPFEVGYTVAKILETKAKFSRDYKEPVLTCYGIGILAKSMTMNIDKAKNKLEYNPIQTTEETIDEFINWWKNK